jgi:hypothetical protein
MMSDLSLGLRRDLRYEALLRNIQREIEQTPELALRGRLICKGFRAGLAAGVRRGKPFEEVAQVLREEIFGTPASQPEGRDDDR